MRIEADPARTMGRWATSWGQAKRRVDSTHDALYARLDALLTDAELDALITHWNATARGEAPTEAQAIMDRLRADAIAGPLLAMTTHYDKLLGRAWRPGCIAPPEKDSK